MSEVQPRSFTPRGRGSFRGGSGRGFSSRGRGGYPSGRSGSNASLDTFEDEGEVGQLKRQFSGQLSQLMELFPDWTSEDIVFALKENHGDVQLTATSITDGLTSQWGEVKKKTKDRSRSKVKEPSPSAGANNDPHQSSPRRSAKPGSGSFEAPRGSRGRGSRGGRGRGGAVNGVPRLFGDHAKESYPSAIDAPTAVETGPLEGDKRSVVDSSVPAWLEETKKESESNGSLFENSSTPPNAQVEASRPTLDRVTAATKTTTKPPVAKSSWANALFGKPAPLLPTPVQKKPPPPKQPTVQPAASQQPAPEPKELEHVEESLPTLKEPTPDLLPTPAIPQPVEPTPAAPVEPEPTPEPESQVTPEIREPTPPPPQPLTEVNLEKIEDSAPPPPTMTQASTITTSMPPVASSTRVPSPQRPTTTPQPAVSRQVHTGVAMPKGTPGRGSSYNRRVLDQQEGVVMPSNHGAVEHTTLQFGSMGLNGDIDDDEELEQAETVSQPPQPSPIAQPVTSLPPTGPSQLPMSQPPATEALPTPRAPGLATHPHAALHQPSPQPPVAPQSMTQQPHQMNSQLASQYSRYGIPETQASQAKAFEAFAHSAQQQQHPVPPQPQAQPQTQAQPQQAQPQAYGNYAPSPLQPQQQPSHIGVGVSAAPDQQQQYNYYNDRSQPPGFGTPYSSNYMQQGQTQQDVGANQQRASSGLGGTGGDGLGQAVPTSAGAPNPVQQQTSRYSGQAGEQGSGHATPSPAIPTVQQTSQPHQPSVAQQYPGQLPYGYQHPYYSQFIPQSYYNQPTPFKNHQGMYYPQAYMTPQYSDHSSSPAGLGVFGAPSGQGREGVSGLGDYSRMNTSATQQQQQALPHSSTGGYGSGIPNFLGSRGLPQEQQQLGAGVGQQQAGQQGQTDESLKFAENKPPTGPSGTPSIPGQPGRPGSATSNLGPQHGGQTPAGMYGSHLNHGLHGHQAQSQYGVGQGQSGANQYSMYSGGYPYGQTSGRHSGTGWGQGYGH